ncbi:MAG: hypothetical protein J0L66_04565 [Cytophagales bacterium]|nr:hypothetical protein [Cytophagales bacterium]
MKEITLRVEDRKFKTLVSFLKTLDYVKVSEDRFTLRDFQRSLAEVKLMRAGKLPKKQIEQLLNEL